jgi:hypothetical protein
MVFFNKAKSLYDDLFEKQRALVNPIVAVLEDIELLYHSFHKWLCCTNLSVKGFSAI